MLHTMRDTQNQARRVAVAAPQTEFPRLCFGAAYSPIAQGESHFLYERQERDNDLRASCRSSDSGGLPPSPFRTGPKQIQARPIVVGVVQIRCPRCGVEHQPIAQGESHFLYEWQERDSDLRAPCGSSDSGSLPPKLHPTRSKQIQARRVVAAAPQTEFPRLCFGAAYPPKNRGESHFLYGVAERDNDLRASCRSSDSGSLPPSPFLECPKQIQARRVAVAAPQTEFAFFGADCLPIARGESHFLYECEERDNDPRAPCRSSDSGSLPPSPFRECPKQIQARRVAVAEPQTEFAFFGADCLPIARGESHFLYECEERDNDPRVPCRSSDSGSLPPSPFRECPKQIQARRVAVAEPQTEFAFFGADCLPIARGESHFLYECEERDNDPRVPCRSSDSGSLPPSPFRECPKQIQARRVAVAAPQTEFAFFGADCLPIARGESHFLYECEERDNDPRVPCRSSDSGSLPPSPFRECPKQIQARRVAVAAPQTEFAFFGADCLPIARGESHFLYECEERDNDPRAPCRSSDSGSLHPNPLHAGPKQIQARRVAVAEPQAEFVRGAAYSPIDQDESHFPYGYGERDSDLRAPCRSSDSGSLPPSPFRKCPKQIQARRVAVAEPQTEFLGLCFGAA